MPLQFGKVRDISLLFVYLEICHYNFIVHRFLPLYTLTMTVDPLTSVVHIRIPLHIPHLYRRLHMGPTLSSPSSVPLSFPNLFLPAHCSISVRQGAASPGPRRRSRVRPVLSTAATSSYFTKSSPDLSAMVTYRCRASSSLPSALGFAAATVKRATVTSIPGCGVGKRLAVVGPAEEEDEHRVGHVRRRHLRDTAEDAVDEDGHRARRGTEHAHVYLVERVVHGLHRAVVAQHFFGTEAPRHHQSCTLVPPRWLSTSQCRASFARLSSASHTHGAPRGVASPASRAPVLTLLDLDLALRPGMVRTPAAGRR